MSSNYLKKMFLWKSESYIFTISAIDRFLVVMFFKCGSIKTCGTWTHTLQQEMIFVFNILRRGAGRQAAPRWGAPKAVDGVATRWKKIEQLFFTLSNS